MRRMLQLVVGLLIVVSIATLATGITTGEGCCSCACPPEGNAPGFDTCTDITGDEQICGLMCGTQSCGLNFFANGTMCSALAESCDTAGTAAMAPAAAPAGLAVLAAVLSGLGVFYLRRR